MFYPIIYGKAKECFIIANLVPCLSVRGDMA